MGHRRGRVVQGILAVGALLGALLGIPQQAHADPAPPQPTVCKPWVIISAYGADASAGPGAPWGSPVNSQYIGGITEALKAKGIGTAARDPDGNPRADDAVDIRNLSYPANALRYWPWEPGYDESLRLGKEKLAQEVSWYNTTCGKGTNLILLGYSMGAHLMKQAMQDPLLQANQEAVAAVVNVADPSRSNGQAGMAQSGQMRTVTPDFAPAEAQAADGGLLQRATVPETFSGFLGDGRYHDICRTDDQFCNRPGQTLPGDWVDIAKRAADSEGPHGDYARGADSTGAQAVESALTHQAERNTVPPGPPPAPGTGDTNPPDTPPPPQGRPDDPPAPPHDPNDTSCAPHGDTDATGAAAIKEACAVVGADTWYTWGGGHGVNPPGATFGHVDSSDPEQSRDDPNRRGFDCSGFVRYAFYKATGYDVLGDRTAEQMYNASWPVRMTAGQGEGALRPGDLVFFGTAGNIHHTAIYLGNGQIAEAPQSDEKIRVAPLRSHDDYTGAVRISGAGGGGGGDAPQSTWGTNVRTHTEPSVGSAVHSTFPGPTGIRVDCQRRAERVTSEGYTSDVWSRLPDDGGSWVSNIYVKGPEWIPGVPACDGDPGQGGPPGDGAGSQRQTWGTDVTLRSGPSSKAQATDALAKPTTVRVDCQARGEEVTADGVTNDAWAHLPDRNAWVSNIYLRGGAWLEGVPECDTDQGGGYGDNVDFRDTWGDDVRVHREPAQGSPDVTTLQGPSQVRVQCQVHAEQVTAEGYTNDAWSYLSDRRGWVSNIYLKGGAWQDGVPLCAPGNPPPGR
ncbi:NlpC/P60 family protein [Streptomyces sp. 5-6(2022)]|uniref:NlpC/P60 family protein n=1 Tax=Streptomyces sp. 5-6(2022) TaxID=2936510 RepID=UPI0023BA0E31|nr:NlpC/P60 family protein [Streptomyces sp. 5-6(2022)]